jgi:hypothetical protein
MFSMAGNELPQWQAMVTDFRGKLHDYNSQASLVYLGYPINHNAYQLNGLLSKLVSKLQRHSQILMGRNLPIQGRSHVVKSYFFPGYGIC